MKKSTVIKKVKKDLQKEPIEKPNKKASFTKYLAYHTIKVIFWFGVGAVLGFIFLTTFSFIIFQKIYGNAIYPGIAINNINVGGKTQQDVENLFLQKNQEIENSSITLSYDLNTATASAKDLNLGYNGVLLAHQAYSIGRSGDIFSNMRFILQAYINGINLPPSYMYSDDALRQILAPSAQNIKFEPVDALFTFQNGKVTAFQPSKDGQDIDYPTLGSEIIQKVPAAIANGTSSNFSFQIPIKIIKPKRTTESANSFGIKELIGEGTSLFYHSIPSRVHNVVLAASRLNGVLIAPNEDFSFDKALGDVSAFTGYQQAYVIQNGKTVLGDGGGVCQVSTTFFRALLNAGLPIIERHAHAYRVGYYEEDSPPGIDATVFVPTVDLKFKNDSGHYILVQTVIDPNDLRLTFYLYGVKDGRDVSMTTPVVGGQIAPPPPLYQDDPTLPKGQLKQIDFEAWGAHVSFNRTVKRNGKIIIADTFVSNFQPWQAVYLRGTQ